jgi:hypothetical protein
MKSILKNALRDFSPGQTLVVFRPHTANPS